MHVIHETRVSRGQLLNPNFGGSDKLPLIILRASQADELMTASLLAPEENWPIGGMAQIQAPTNGLMPIHVIGTYSKVNLQTVKRLLKREFRRHPLSLIKSPTKFIKRALRKSGISTADLRRTERTHEDIIYHNHRTESRFSRHFAPGSSRSIKVLTFHSPVSVGRVQAVLACAYDHVVFLMESQRKEFYALCREMGAHNLPNSSIIPSPVSRDFNLNGHVSKRRMYLTWVGTFEGDIFAKERKGLAELLVAWGEIQNEFSDLDLCVVGGGPGEKVYAKFAAGNGIRVRFTDPLSAEGVAQILSESTLFAMPSRAEGLALSYLEATAMGCGLLGREEDLREISQAIPGTPVWRLDMRTASHFDLVAQLRRALIESSDCDETSRSLFAREAFRRYSEDTVAAAYLTLYKELLADAPVRSASPKAAGKNPVLIESVFGLRDGSQHEILAETMQSLSALGGQHRGEQVYVIGTAPSLQAKELRAAAQSCTVGVNFVDKASQFAPTFRVDYLLVEDPDVFSSLLMRSAAEWFPKKAFLVSSGLLANQRRLDSLFEASKRFGVPIIPFRLVKSTEPGDRPWVPRSFDLYATWSANVIFTALQFAAFIGAQKIVILGVDNKYGKKPYFFPDREAKKRKPADIDRKNKSLIAFKRYCTAAGIQLENESVASPLEIIPRAGQ